MTGLTLSNVFVKCIVFALVIGCSFESVNTIPAADEEEIPDDIVREKIEAFKQDILSKLGYSKPPDMSNVTQDIDEKRKMIQQYRQYIQERDSLYPSEDDEDEDESSKIHSKTFYSLDHRGELPPAVNPDDWAVNRAVRLYFNSNLKHPASDHTRELHIHSAKLNLYIKAVRPDNLQDTFSVDKVIRLNAYQLLSITNTTAYKRTLLDSILVPLTDTGWVSFEIAKAIQSWVNSKESNLGLEIAAESQDIHSVISIDMSVPDTDKGGMVSLNSTANSANVKIYAEERDILKRVKRRSERSGRRICRKGQGETRCCKYEIEISFSDIGWDWIIAPLTYKGFYCAGTCPYRYKMANNFSFIKSLLHLKHPKRVPSPCCVASKLSPFTVLHYDTEKRYIFTDYADLVVKQCKCG